MKVKVSAPGKLMLFGEHAVIYGYPCIVTAVDKRLFVEAEDLGLKDEILSPQVTENKFVRESVTLFKKKFKINVPVRITTFGDLSQNVGLGSSSAVTVATIKALSVLFSEELSKREIFDMSYRVDLKIQGVGSGFDLAAATYGGTLNFVSSGKVIEPVKIKPLQLIVGYSGKKADTSTIVKGLRSKIKYKKTKELIFKIFDQIGKIVRLAKKSLDQEDYTELGKLMTRNHRLLQKLGVSTPKLDQMVNAAIEAGAYGAKLSGAGGGDCMIAIAPEAKRHYVEDSIISTGGEIISIKNNAQGVKLEK